MAVHFLQYSTVNLKDLFVSNFQLKPHAISCSAPREDSNKGECQLFLFVVILFIFFIVSPEGPIPFPLPTLYSFLFPFHPSTPHSSPFPFPTPYSFPGLFLPPTLFPHPFLHHQLIILPFPPPCTYIWFGLVLDKVHFRSCNPQLYLEDIRIVA